jgi:putative ATPase
VGLPEGRFHLAEAALYLATAPKSNSIFAFFDALTVVEKEREGEVPAHLRDGSRDKEGFGHGEGYLYPHAYRDHWVAQQYLPATLQGRTFYDPGDQGYERGIREQVARRREAQLAAMVEGGAHLEILTFEPGAREHDRWLQRTIDNAGERLGRVRDRVLDAAAIQRHHVVLDLHAGAGLLTWEALRRAPEGGTWALARDREAAEGLRQQAARLPELQRPVVLAGDPAELGDLLALRGEGDVRFDAIVGRNALGPLPDKAAALRELIGWLRPGGRLSLAETVVRGAQRLYDLVDLSALEEEVRTRLMEAEEAIYLEGDDQALAHLVGWDADDLQVAAEAAGLESVEVDEEVQQGEMLVGPAAIGRWFAAGSDSDRPSYAAHLRRRLSADEVAQVERIFRGQLTGQTVPWRTRFAYLVARAPGN